MKSPKNKIKLRHAIFLLLLIILLVMVRWSWHNNLMLSNPPSVQQGVLDLRGIELELLPPLTLDGEWLFYPEQWIDASNIEFASHGQLLRVPGNWNAVFDHSNNKAYGYGTYYMRILLDRPLLEPLSIRFQSIYTASEVEINGQVFAKQGILANEWEEHVSETKTFLVTYAQENQSELHLFVRVANYESPLKGGIVRSAQFGTQKKIDQIYWTSIGLQLIVCVIFLLHALYALIIFFMNIRKTELIIFILMIVAGAMTIALKYNELLFLWIHIDFEWTVKLKAMASMWFAFFALLMGRVLVGIKRKGLIFYSYFFLLISYSLFVIAGSEEMVFYSLEKEIYMLLYYVPLFWTSYYFMRMVFNKGVGALFLLFSALCVINNILWGTVYYTGTAQFIFYPVDLIAAITSFSAYWFKRYIHNSDENELLNAKLAEANKVKDRFLANTSHELRTPLHGIMNIAQSVLTRKKDVLDEQSQHDMELLMMVSRRMSLMLNDLLDVVRLQDKRIILHKTSVQVQSVAAGVLDMLRFLTDDRKQLELSMNIEEDLPHVYADEERLVQVLINLVHNAIKYTQEGSVELTAEQENEHVWIHVRDTGVGIDEAMLKRLFLPYEQGKFGGGGIGLGLSICKELVELHGSELIVHSQPGKGSVFSFKLPVLDEKVSSLMPPFSKRAKQDRNPLVSIAKITAETTAMVAASNSIKEIDYTSMLFSNEDPIRVLAVDDDPINLKVLMNILSTETYHVECVYSAREALDKLYNGQWDLVIADVMMPGISGYELTKLIRERFTLYELPIILLTARSEPEDIYAGFLAGANDYVTKPVDAMELRYRVWSLSSLKQAVNDRLRIEAAYLQAQIHPHFLFNTLNTILALSDIDTEKMRKLAEAFTSYLRISFDFLSTGQMVPLSKELELVENYLYIEQQRFEERLQVEWEVNADLEMMIPPLIVQPLVENAVQHGILRLVQGGTVRIQINMKVGAVHFSVRDTGIGIDDEQISRLLNPSGKENRGIGLVNTHSRLTRLYGQGLQVQSKLGEGTTVSFTIPDSMPQ